MRARGHLVWKLSTLIQQPLLSLSLHLALLSIRGTFLSRRFEPVTCSLHAVALFIYLFISLSSLALVTLEKILANLTTCAGMTPQNGNISSVLSIFKYNPGKTKNLNLLRLCNIISTPQWCRTDERVKKATNLLYTVWSLVTVRKLVK